MWIDCEEAFVNIDKIDYIGFTIEYECPVALVYFQGRVDPLKFYNDSMDELRNFFGFWLNPKRLKNVEESFASNCSNPR